jgi:predicted methyltransferase
MKIRNTFIDKAKLKQKKLINKQLKNNYKSRPNKRIIKDLVESFYSDSEALEIINLQEKVLPEICELLTYHLNFVKDTHSYTFTQDKNDEFVKKIKTIFLQFHNKEIDIKQCVSELENIDKELMAIIENLTYISTY